jgi:transcription elongation factor GreA
MQQELDYRRITKRPQLLEAVKEARAFGDLSENFEYKAAKKEKNANESRIRYLERMIETAIVIEDRSASDEIGLYDKIVVYCADIDEEETYQIVTTMREDALHGLISRESPVGRALLGHKVGDRVQVTTGNGYQYEIEIRQVEKGQDDGSIPIASF